MNSTVGPDFADARLAILFELLPNEIIAETPEANAEQVKKLLEEIMVNVFDKLFKKQVPIEVDAKICENWGGNEGVCDLCGSPIEFRSPPN